MRLSLWIAMQPQPKQRHRTGNGRTYTPAETEAAEALIRTCWAARFGTMPKGGWAAGAALRLTVVVYLRRPASNKRPFPSVRPDWDNFGKLASDALNGVAMRDDGQVTTATVLKRYCDDEHPAPGVLIVIEDDIIESLGNNML